jgi:hypothetical protein
MELGTRKMPPPIIVPTMIETASRSPMRRGRSRNAVAGAPELIGRVSALGRSVSNRNETDLAGAPDAPKSVLKPGGLG